MKFLKIIFFFFSQPVIAMYFSSGLMAKLSAATVSAQHDLPGVETVASLNSWSLKLKIWMMPLQLIV